MANITVGQMKALLEKFEDDGIVIHFDGPFRDKLPDINHSLNEFQYGPSWEFNPPRPEWHYKPTDESRSRGNAERVYPAFHGYINLGDF